MMTDKLKHAWGDAQGPEEVEQRYLDQLRASERAREQGRMAARRLGLRLRQGVPVALKRTLDVLLGGLLLLALAPLMLVTALCIWLEDRGPALYVHQRVGRGGQLFRMLKFRSMAIDADRRLAALQAENESAAGVLFKMRRDPRITRVGRVIRRWSIDELPQLLNVLRGDMSLVGPRPALPHEVAQHTQEERSRLAVLPGITCLWQVSGRSQIDFKGQVRLDLEYIREQSVFQDAWLLLRTIPAALFGKGAY